MEDGGIINLEQDNSQSQNKQEGNEGNILSMYSEEEIDNFRCIFEMFDKDKTSFIDVSSLQTILRSLGRDPNEAIELLKELELNDENGGRIDFTEFLKIMKSLENKLVQGQNQDEEGSPREATLEERIKYGSLLPRTGVHFLPDSKVVDFLKLLDDYRKKCIKEMNLAEARRAQLKFEDLRSKETLRQLQNMRQAQEQELLTVENAQRSQFLEFSQAWDNYMSDYEATAYLSLEKLKEKHLLEIQQMKEKIRKEYKLKLKFTKELMDMRKQVHTLISLKKYEEAEALKNECDQREQTERAEVEGQIEDVIGKQEERLRTKQQMALAALLKRIQRDRNEQLKHRQIDSQRLIQRNKNLLLDLLNKQNVETRRTNQFLKFALGARSPERKNYFKSRLYTAPEDAKLKIDGEDLEAVNKTMYNNRTNNSFAAGIKNQHFSQSRARTSTHPLRTSNGVKRIIVKENQENLNSSFMNNRNSQTANNVQGNNKFRSTGGVSGGNDDEAHIKNQKEVKLPSINLNK